MLLVTWSLQEVSVLCASSQLPCHPGAHHQAALGICYSRWCQEGVSVSSSLIVVREHRVSVSSSLIVVREHRPSHLEID